MKIKRIIGKVGKVVSITVVIFLFIGIANVYFEENSGAISRVIVVAMYLDEPVAEALQTVCMDGAFSTVTGLQDIGVHRFDLIYKNQIVDIEFRRKDMHTVFITALLPAIYVNFPWRSTAVPEGSSLTYEYVCTADKAFSSRLTDSTVPKKYLHKKFRRRLSGEY